MYRLLSLVLVLVALFLLTFRVQWASPAPPPFRAVPAQQHVLADLYRLLHPQRRARPGRNPLDVLHRHARPKP